MQVWTDQHLLHCKSETVPISETMLADIKPCLHQCNEKCKEVYDEYT